jgi:hypothetical protein
MNYMLISNRARLYKLLLRCRMQTNRQVVGSKLSVAPDQDRGPIAGLTRQATDMHRKLVHGNREGKRPH